MSLNYSLHITAVNQTQEGNIRSVHYHRRPPHSPSNRNSHYDQDHTTTTTTSTTTTMTCSASASCERMSCPGVLPERFRHWWKWMVTVSLAVVYFVSWGNIHSYPLLFKPLQEEFHTTAVETGWVGSVTIGVNSLASPLAAMLERKFGFRATTVLGIVCCAVGVFSSSFAPQLFYLYFTYGVLYGVGINLTYHTSLCLMVQYFPLRNCRRATSIIMCGGTTGMLVFSPFMERMIQWLTWRGALRISGIIVLCLGFPFALLCKSPVESTKQLKEDATSGKKCSCRCAAAAAADSDEEAGGKSRCTRQQIYPEDDVDDRKGWRSESSEDGDNEEMDDQEKELSEKASLRSALSCDENANCGGGVCEKNKMEKEIALLGKGVVVDEVMKSDFHKWLFILNNWRCWAFIISIFISTFSWSFYWVNLVSHLSNVGLSQRQGAFILTTCAAAELLSKCMLALLGDRLPVSNVAILGLQGLITSAFTVGVMLIRDFGGGMGIILGVGMMRGVYQVVPYMSCVEIIGVRWGDEAQTLTLVIQGLGYLVGALPSGAIYDVTNSYETCLIMVFILFIVSSMALYTIMIYDRYCAKRRNEAAEEVVKSADFTRIPADILSEVVADRITTV